MSKAERSGYVIVSADNVGYDIFVSRIFIKNEVAVSELKRIYRETLEDIDGEEVEESSVNDSSFKILSTNGDIFYGQIKAISIP